MHGGVHIFRGGVSAGAEKRTHAGDVVTPHGVVQVVGCSLRAGPRAEHAGADGLVLLLGESRCEGGSDDDDDDDEEEEEDVEGEGARVMRGEEHQEQGAASESRGSEGCFGLGRSGTRRRERGRRPVACHNCLYNGERARVRP